MSISYLLLITSESDFTDTKFCVCRYPNIYKLKI